MSWEMQTIEQPVARKDYHCDASEWIENSGLSDDEYKPQDLALIKAAKDDRYKIIKGSKYYKCSGKWEGEFEVFRARPELHRICIDYELYPDP